MARTGSVGTVFLDVAVNQLNINKLGNSWGKSFAGIGKVIGGAMAVTALTAFARSAIQMGSDLAEVQNVVDVTFGGMSRSVSEWAKTASASFGLNELKTKKYVGTMGAMLKSSGLSSDSAVTMSKSLTGLAGDFASFYNLKHDEAFAKIRAGISGETEPLKQLGINLSIANMEAFALSKGINKTYNAMSQAEQSLLRYNYLMSASADAQGDFTRTSASWANQTRILANQWGSFKASFGQGLINLFAPIIRGINSIMAGLVNLGNTFSAVTGVLFGNQSMASVGADATVAADAVNDLAAATKAAGKAAGKSQASFDTLNILASKSSSGGSKVSGSTGSIGVIKTAISASAITPPDTSSIEAWAEKLQRILNFQNLIDSWNNLKNAITPIGEKVGEGLKWLWDNILVPFGAWVIGDVIPAFFNSVASAAEILNSGIEALKPLGGWLWVEFLQPLGEWTGGLIVDILSGIEAGLSAISDWINDNQSTVETIGIIVGSFAAAWGLVNAALAVSQVVISIVTLLTGLFTGTISAAALATTIFGGVLAVVTSPVTLVIAAIAALIAIGILLYKNWDKVSAWLKKAWSDISSFAVNLWGGVRDWFTRLWGDISGGVRNAWNGIITFFTGFAERIRGIFGGIRSFVSGIWDGLIDGVKSVFNFLSSGLNALIRGINRISFNIPDWVPVIGGRKFGFNIPEIPRLAKGGIVDQPTLAMIGEAGKEAVVPLENNTGWIDLLASKIASASTSGGGDIYLTENIYLDSGELVDTITRKINRKSRQANRTAFATG